MSDLLIKLGNCLQDGDRNNAVELARQALKEGIDPEVILNKGLIGNGMDHVGHKFREGEMFVPEVLASARVMHLVMEILKPHLVEKGSKPIGKAVIGSVLGDHHDIGKNIVIMMLTGAGFEVKDLGVNVPPQVFIDEAESFGADLIGMSTLLTTTIGAMQKTCALIKESKLKDKVKVIVGGAPLNEKISLDAGADAYAENAGEAVIKSKELLNII